MSSKVMVTGTAGFVGSHLAARLLEEGHSVIGVDSFTDYYDIRIKERNLAPLLEDSRFSFIGESLGETDLDAILDDVSCVFHQAAQAGVRASWGEQFETYIDSNIRATQILCEALKGRPGTRLVYASSSSVYGETSQLPMRETHLCRPVSPYGVTKLDAENLCLLYNVCYGVPVVCLRYFTVYGPRQRPDMAFHRFIRAAVFGGKIEVYGNGMQTRDFTFIDDIVGANLAAMSYEGTERVFNIGGGSRVTLSHVIDVIRDHARGEFDVRFQDRQRGDVTHTYADISLAGRELGYTPKVKLEEGIELETRWIESIYRSLDQTTS